MLNSLIEDLKKAVEDRLLFEKKIVRWVGRVVKRIKEKGTGGALRRMLRIPKGKSIKDVYTPEELAKKFLEGSTLLKRRLLFAINLGKAKGDSYFQKVYSIIKREREKKKKVKESDEEFLANLILDYQDPESLMSSVKENFFFVSPEVQKILLERAPLKLKKVVKGGLKKKLGLGPKDKIEQKFTPFDLVSRAKRDPKIKKAVQLTAALLKKKKPYWKKVSDLLKKK